MSLKGLRRTGDGYYQSLDGRFLVSREPGWLVVDTEGEELNDRDQEVQPSYPVWSMDEVLELIGQLRDEGEE